MGQLTSSAFVVMVIRDFCFYATPPQQQQAAASSSINPYIQVDQSWHNPSPGGGSPTWVIHEPGRYEVGAF
ncbi:hypothetical protein SAMD00023353_1302230 [Rosellinia necatrix]|uniref:Uncharacterized protein n=1 Tax=Rosellinia necatrix TaxID=77044 RepID=A0A1S8A7C2_ROSNE|nr:hypothetical protein SAMD00023353_1302230 [Rosellinia necatrix]